MHQKLCFWLLILISTFGFATASAAKNNPLKYGDIEYTVREYSPSANIKNSIFVPETLNGMAVAVLPSCSGVQDWSVSDLHRWTKLLLENNFVVSVTDTMPLADHLARKIAGKAGKLRTCAK